MFWLDIKLFNCLSADNFDKKCIVKAKFEVVLNLSIHLPAGLSDIIL